MKKYENRPKYYLNGFFTGRFYLHPDFNRVKMPSGEMNQMNLIDPTQTDK